MKKQWIFLTLTASLVAVGCGDDGRTGGVDGGGIVLGDSSVDAPPPPPSDAGDAGRDSGRVDAAVACTHGEPCTAMRGCSSATEQCYVGSTGVIGEDEPIFVTLSDGGVDTSDAGATLDAGIPTDFLSAGYCTAALPDLVSNPTACNPDDSESCGDCARCLVVGDQMGVDITMCLTNCVPNLTDRSGCYPGQACSPTGDFDGDATSDGICFAGCINDGECRVAREDTNGNGEIDDMDALVYDSASTATCNTATGRCQHDGKAGAKFGDACLRDSDCPPNGECFTEPGFGIEGGFCTKRACDVLDGCDRVGGMSDTCMPDGVFGISLCTPGCEIGGAGEVLLGAAGHGAGCRDGHACFWDQTNGPGTQNGGCFPGNFNEVTANNIGDPCMDADACFSPGGIGICLSNEFWDDSMGRGICSLSGCGDPGRAEDVCGEGNDCVNFAGTGEPPITFCIPRATTAADCPPGWAATELGLEDPPGTAIKSCFPLCQMTSDCRTGETCNIPMGDTFGECE